MSGYFLHDESRTKLVSTLYPVCRLQYRLLSTGGAVGPHHISEIVSLGGKKGYMMGIDIACHPQPVLQTRLPLFI